MAPLGGSSRTGAESKSRRPKNAGKSRSSRADSFAGAVAKRSAVGAARLESLAERSDARLIGRRVAVPYHYYISDDESGCCCDGTVIAVGDSRGGLVSLVTEEGTTQAEQWHPISLIRRWLQPEVDPLCTLMDQLPSISPESSRPPPPP